ncbi:MAG: CBS domain-containing protein [Actinomycetota bacterium]|nr:CBS domain-containing protein [Actinomycetota bacterium]
MPSSLESAVTVGDIMVSPAPYVRCADHLVSASRLMRDLDLRALPICEPDGRVVGMLRDRDIVTCCVAEDDNPSTVTAREFAEGPPVRVRPWLRVHHALHLMLSQRLTYLPVVEHERLVGFIDLGAVLDATAAQSALPPRDRTDVVEAAEVVDLDEHRDGCRAQV